MSTDVTPGIRYHFIITLGAGFPDKGDVTNTASGVIDFPPGTTRAAAYADIRERAREAMGSHWVQHQAPITTVFFSLEPDELPVPAALNGASR